MTFRGVARGMLFSTLLLSGCAGMTSSGGGDEPDPRDTLSGNGDGGGGGSSPDVNLCPTDCSTLAAPPCFRGECNGSKRECEFVPDDGAACDDGFFCTVGETCKAGVCGGGTPNDCGLGADGCTVVSCDEATKQCSSSPAADGVACPAKDLCTVNSVCKSGVCTGLAKDCFFAPGAECNVVACNPANGECEAAPDASKNGAKCEADGDKCMVEKKCQDGQCTGGVPKDCSTLTSGCQNGTCDPASGACYPEPVPEGGQCLAATDTCNKGICTNGQCTPTPANDGGACDDGNSCTGGETCLAGVCQGGSTAGYVEYFSEDFSDNSAGWALDTDWEIGPAQPWAGCGSSNPDPTEDHTPTADNGLAGVVIGGCAPVVVHPYYYLTSPPFDTSAAPGSIHLTFWRHLNSDYGTYMDNSIEIFDGTSWVSIWNSGSAGTYDSAWIPISHDITAFKGPSTRVRFGFKVGSTGAFVKGSWNIDDIVVANQVCL